MSAAAQAARANIAPVDVPAVLERLDDPRRRVVRSVRHRQDRAEDVGRQVPRPAGARPRDEHQPAGRPDRHPRVDRSSTATARFSMRTGNVQFNELGVDGEQQFRHSGLGSTQFDPALPRPTNWEESVSVQHELFPRVSVTGGYYHRTFQHIQYTKNTLVDPVADYQPFTITVPANAEPARWRRQVDHRVQPEPDQARHRQQRADVVRQQLAGLQRLRVQRERASAARRLHVRRHHDRAHGDQHLHRPRRTRTRTTCGSAIRCRRSRRCTRRRAATRCRGTSS